MRDPKVVLDNLVKQSKINGYKFERLYRNLYNINFYTMAYAKIYHKEGNMTKGIDGSTIDGFNIKQVEKLIESIKDESYQPNPAKRVYIPKKNGSKRPLGIPSFYDKLVQEVVRVILESIYEKNFSVHSHGFRPNRSCHTAILEIKRSFTGTKWFIEGDIKGFFDNINHHILINILKRKIKDEKFINLIWKFLKAGYIEDWVYHNTYSGTPQGGIISPILSNIYLNEFDDYMEQYIKSFNKGNLRTVNPEYKAIQYQVRKRKQWVEDGYRKVKKGPKSEIVEINREGIINEIKELHEKQLRTEYSDPLDEKFKKLRYVRYADDFIIGVIGSKSDAEEIKKDIKDFLKKHLSIELSEEKTLITNGKDFAKFLGYNITVTWNDNQRKNVIGDTKRTVNGAIGLYVPYENWRNKLLNLKAMRIETKNNKEIWKPIHRVNLVNCDALEILTIYNSEIRGLYNYYCLANNVSVLNKFSYIMEYSLYKTLANKFKTSIPKIITKYKIGKDFGVKYETKKGPKIAFFYNEGFKRKNIVTKSEDNFPQNEKYFGRTGLLERLNANRCEICGTTNAQMEVHHVRKLKDLKGKKKWEEMMIARNRKTMVLCKKCHRDLHSGKLD